MMSDRYILGVHSGHNSSAAIMKNGTIVAAVQEERLWRKKNYVGHPSKSIDCCLKIADISGKDLTRIAYTTKKISGLFLKAKPTTEFSIRDYHDYYGDKYYVRRIQGKDTTDYLKWLRDAPKFNQAEKFIDFSYLTDEVLGDPEREIALYSEKQVETLSTQLGVDKSRIEHLDHHTCHAAYAYYGSPFRDEDCAIITLDGWGDGRNQTVWKVSDNKMKLLAESDQNDIGRVYKMATLLLGMRPDEHEFKVMGLAPYAKKSYVLKAYEAISRLSKVDKMRIVEDQRPADLYSYLKDAWKDQRFDNIAGAVQNFAEALACRLVESINKETGLTRFVLGGGISMNVKMNKRISEMDCVSDMYVCGSGGDESLSLGGCYLINSEYGKNEPLNNLYLGFDITSEMDTYDWKSIEKKFSIKRDIDHDLVASLLVKGDTVAVIRGRAEFGARALGNRSILADPSKRETVMKINEAIKNRDFWMPFALSILEEHHKDYINNPKNIKAPFMATGMDTLPDNYKRIEAGTHPYDKSVRPQFVSKENAPEYHSLISSFMKLTGIPAILNTSFNLHGEPIVNTIADAVRTFEFSGLDHLLINDEVLVSKNG